MSAPTEPAFDPKLGQLLLGRYRIVRKLGEGGMGAVYEGKHELIGKRLAIKCLHPQYMSNREVVERFHREANAATAVGNEHIIEVSDVGSFDDGSPFIVMEFLEGVELGRLLETEGSLPIGRLVHIVTQLCGALSAAHARGIVHRDMKPENVYLIKRGNDPDFVKVLDFGISKMKEQNEALGGASLTKTGMALGTPYYMPPEQAQGVRDLDHRADIYAVGVILYQGLTGHLPFDADTYPALMVKILTEPAAPPSTYRQDVPPELEQVVLRAMAKDRARRFQTMDELSVALAPFAALDGAPRMIATPKPAPVGETTPFHWTQGNAQASTAAATQAQHRKPVALLAFGALAGVLIVVGAIAAMRSSGDEPVATPAPRPAPAAVPSAPAPMPVAAAQPAVPMGPAVVAPKPTEVQVKISALPSEARIYIGEVEFPNPMDAFRPRSLDPVRIRVELAGYRSVEQLAIFDQDRAITFELEKGRGVKRLETLGAPAPAPTSDKQPTAKAVEIKPVAAPPPTEAPGEKPAEKPSTDGVYRGPTGTLRDDF